MTSGFEIRQLSRDELGRVAEIDRTEHIDVLYDQDGERLVERHGGWDSTAWERDGDGEHSIEAKERELHGYLDIGGVAIAALVDGRFYLGRGFLVTAHPLSALLELEPYDVHMHKTL